MHRTGKKNVFQEYLRTHEQDRYPVIEGCLPGVPVAEEAYAGQVREGYLPGVPLDVCAMRRAGMKDVFQEYYTSGRMHR
jgi:hypothetical protein